MPYSSLGRGYLTGKITKESTFAENDIRHKNPHFTEDAIEANGVVAELLECIAKEKDGTPAQIALAWLPVEWSQKMFRSRQSHHDTRGNDGRIRMNGNY